jgi:hypothetical protein
LSEEGRREREVIVLDEDKRRAAGGFLDDGRRESHIGSLVHPKVARAEYGPDAGVVAQRPECLVREAIVVSTVLILSEPKVTEPILRVGGRHVQSTAIVHNNHVGVPGGVCHPCSGLRFNQWLESGDESTRRARHDYLAIGRSLMLEGGAVRKHDHTGPGARFLCRDSQTFPGATVNVAAI